jgi:hypothetical protein
MGIRMERTRELKASGWCRQERGEGVLATKWAREERSTGARRNDTPATGAAIRTSVDLFVVLMVDANVCAEITLAKTALSSCNHTLVSVLD